MNILILNWRDTKHPLAGGAEQSLFEHAEYWIKQGAKVTWFSSQFPEGKEKDIIGNIRIIRKGSIFTVYFYALFYYLFYAHIYTDIVLDNFHFIPFFTPLYVKKKKIIAVIHEVAGKVWYKNISFPFAFIGEKLEPVFFKFYRSIPFITVSESTEKELMHMGIIKKHIEIIHNGITKPKSQKNYKKAIIPTIVFIGRISLDKGIVDVLTLLKELVNEKQKCKLWIIGKEEKKGILNEMLVKFIPQKQFSKITYFGFVSDEKKYELLQKAWLVVNPSFKEGWGLTVIESNFVGTPVIGYNIPGLRDSIQSGKTGILVQKNTPQELAKEVISLLQDKKKYATLSQQAKQFAKNFNWDQAGAKSWKILKRTYESQKTT